MIKINRNHSKLKIDFLISEKLILSLIFYNAKSNLIWPQFALNDLLVYDFMQNYNFYWLIYSEVEEFFFKQIHNV